MFEQTNYPAIEAQLHLAINNAIKLIHGLPVAIRIEYGMGHGIGLHQSMR